MLTYAPRHRRAVAGITYADGTLVFDPSNDATCQCSVTGWQTCPRHNANVYADQQARHATDSIPPMGALFGTVPSRWMA